MNAMIEFQNYSEDDLIKKGFKDNPRLYIGDGYLYCNFCKNYHYHKALSRRIDGLQDNVLVCKNCKTGKHYLGI